MKLQKDNIKFFLIQRAIWRLIVQSGQIGPDVSDCTGFSGFVFFDLFSGLVLGSELQKDLIDLINILSGMVIFLLNKSLDEGLIFKDFRSETIAVFDIGGELKGPEFLVFLL